LTPWVVRVADDSAHRLGLDGGRADADEELDEARDVVLLGEFDGIEGGLDAGEGVGLGGRARREPLPVQHAVELVVGDDGEGGDAEGAAGAVLLRDLEAGREVAGAGVEALEADLVEAGGHLLGHGRVAVAVALLQPAPELQEAAALGAEVVGGEHGVHEDAR
jgi:hypothetical protein